MKKTFLAILQLKHTEFPIIFLRLCKQYGAGSCVLINLKFKNLYLKNFISILKELAYLIYENNENFRGYGFKDPYVKNWFLCFLTFFSGIVQISFELFS